LPCDDRLALRAQSSRPATISCSGSTSPAPGISFSARSNRSSARRNECSPLVSSSSPERSASTRSWRGALQERGHPTEICRAPVAPDRRAGARCDGIPRSRRLVVYQLRSARWWPTSCAPRRRR
jgi:hypothetical protein